MSPIRCLVACSGSNCLPTGSWWPATAPNLNVAARKFQNVWNFHRATCIEQSAPSVRQVTPNGANISPFGANNSPIGIHWNVMARAKLRQWDFAPHGATWSQGAPCLRHYASQTAPDWWLLRAKCHLVARHSAPLVAYKSRAASQDFLTVMAAVLQAPGMRLCWASSWSNMRTSSAW